MKSVDSGRALDRSEAGRLAALEELLILDSAPEEAYDDLVAIASEICGTPIALVSLIDRDRQWFKAKVGLDTQETPRDVAFCAHAIEAPDELFVVSDATRDERFFHNPLVTGDTGIRFYAGMPIVTEDGHALGTVCVIDTEPRTLTSSQERCLRALARQASIVIGLRQRSLDATRIAFEQAGMTTEARLKQEKGAELLDLVLQGRELGLWDLDVVSGRWTASAHELAILGYADAPAEVAALDWRGLIHPDDRELTVTSMAPHLRGEAPYYECTVRMRHRDGRWIWLLSRAVVVQRDATGRPTRIVGTHMDVTEQRRQETERRLAAERLELALVGGDIGIWDLDLATGKVVFSAHWATMLGHPAHEMHAEPDHWRTAMHPDDHEVFVARLAAHLRGELPLIEGEGRIRHKDGRWVWMLTRARIFERDAAGRALRVVGMNVDITDSKRDRLALEHTRHLLEETGRLARIGGWEVDLVAQTLTWSDEVYRIHEVEPHIVPTVASAIEFYAPEARPAMTAAIESAIADGVAWDLELPLVTARGRAIWVRALGHAEYDGGRAVRLVGAFQDVTDRKAADDAIASSARRLGMITDNVPALIMYIDREQRYRFVNAHLQRMLGIRPDAVLGQTMRSVCSAELYAQLVPYVERALNGEAVEFEQCGNAGDAPLHYNSSFVPDVDENGEVAGFYALTSDITELKETQRKLQLLARADPLTGLPNRRHFEERAIDTMARARRSGRRGALLYLDIDRFKSINDTLGHACGDALLQAFAQRVSATLRDTDFVARYAGDEFVAFAEDVGGPAEAAQVAAKIVAATRAPFVLKEVSLFVTTSIGVALYDGGTPIVDVLAVADDALYDAKAAGRNTFALARVEAPDDDRPAT